jgi:2',3'-cyclic-nucleotide 2'-phosphodiesterase (5'-nucleotidase family)
VAPLQIATNIYMTPLTEFMKNLVKLKLASLLILCSCTWGQLKNPNAVKKGHYKLYSAPELEIEKPESGFKRIAIISVNDIKGHFQSSMETINEKNTETEFQFNIGGVEAYAAYFRILKKKFKDELILINSGNSFDIKQSHRDDLFYLNYLNFEYNGIGTREFNLESNYSSTDYLQELIASSKSPFMLTNLFSLKKIRFPEWQNLEKTMIKTVNGIKIGFMHILDPDIVEKIPAKNINGYYLQKPLQVILKEGLELRRQGAQIVILSLISKQDCTGIEAQKMDLPELKTNFYPKKHNCYEEDLVAKLLKQVPSGLVDAVILGGHSSKVNNFIHDIPVIQMIEGGQYFSWMELYYNKKHNIVDQTKTVIHQPIKLCHSMMKDTQDCYLKEGMNNIVEIPAKFLDEFVEISKESLIRK